MWRCCGVDSLDSKSNPVGWSFVCSLCDVSIHIRHCQKTDSLALLPAGNSRERTSFITSPMTTVNPTLRFSTSSQRMRLSPTAMNRRPPLHILLLLLFATPTTAFLSIHHKRVSTSVRQSSTTATTTTFPSLQTLPFLPKSLSPNHIISQLAELAIQFRLSHHDQVTCHVVPKDSSTLFPFLSNPSYQATITGTNWKTPYHLSCRSVSATLHDCQVNWSALMQAQPKLRLSQTATGKMRAILNRDDIAHLVAHPLVPKPVEGMEWNSEHVKVHSENNSLELELVDRAKGKKYLCHIHQRQAKHVASSSSSNSKVAVHIVEAATGIEQPILSKHIEEHLNHFSLNVDRGTRVSFVDFAIQPDDTVMLVLDLAVSRLPGRKVKL